MNVDAVAIRTGINIQELESELGVVWNKRATAADVDADAYASSAACSKWTIKWYCFGRLRATAVRTSEISSNATTVCESIGCS
jgi:hypothetical protein